MVLLAMYCRNKQNKNIHDYSDSGAGGATMVARPRNKQWPQCLHRDYVKDHTVYYTTHGSWSQSSSPSAPRIHKKKEMERERPREKEERERESPLVHALPITPPLAFVLDKHHDQNRSVNFYEMSCAVCPLQGKMSMAGRGSIKSDP